MARTIFRPTHPVDARTLTYFSEIIMDQLRQLRLALGTGTIFYGFEVRQSVTPGSLELSPGLAFDGAGQPVALDSPLPLPLPDEDGPLWLGVRHHLLVDEHDVAGRPTRERDTVAVLWLPSVPRDDETIPLARVQRGPHGWLIDSSVARRAPALEHQHSGSVLPDRSGRGRYDGSPVRLTAPGGESQQQQLARLERAVSNEFSKLHALIQGLHEAQAAQQARSEALRAAIAAREEEGWRASLEALREELSLTLGEEVREELDLLRAEVVALAQRPASVGADLGGFTPIKTLHGVGEKYARLLREVGIESVSDLLAATATPEGRKRLEASELPLAALRRWSRQADLLRLHGAGAGEVELLQSAGIESTAHLAVQDPSDLFARLRDAARTRGDIAPPPLAWVASWITQASHLPPVVEW